MSITRLQFIAMLLIAQLMQGAFAASISGPVKITDGDTVKILDMPIRLEGIDAPETGQTCKRPGGGQYACGVDSTNFLRSMTNNQEVTCEGAERDRYKRLLATCYVGETNINRQMVLNGWAVAYLQYSDTYAEEEQLAKTKRRGIWNGEFVRPHQFRAAAWEGSRKSTDVADQGQCVIKGNINSKGIKIYHAPWSKSYKRTKINIAKGERWFCDEAEAQAAGWRAPYN